MIDYKVNEPPFVEPTVKDSLTVQVDALRGQVAHLRDQLRLANIDFGISETENDSLCREIDALKEERRKDMAEIYSLRESEESLREEVERLRDELRQSSIDITRAEVERLRAALKRHGMHNADCFLRGECNCGLDAALRREET